MKHRKDGGQCGPSLWLGIARLALQFEEYKKEVGSTALHSALDDTIVCGIEPAWWHLVNE
jgi:hypothetical protein